MRVLHLAYYDRYGGAAIAAYRQHIALLNRGVNSQFWVRSKHTNDERVHTYIPTIVCGKRIRRIWRRYRLRRERDRAGIIQEIFDDRSEHGGAELSNLPEADVINIQYAWSFIDYPAFFKWVHRDLPVVVTMHAMENFTGGCPYTNGCTRFWDRCGNCPKLGRRGDNDYTRKSWERRLAAFGSRPKGKLHFVADSNWLGAEARKSSLLAGWPISVIHYGVDTTAYRPLDRPFARKTLAVPDGVPVLAFAAALVDDERKGMRYLIEAVTGMAIKPFLLTWGRNFPSHLNNVPHRHLGNVDSEHLMALAYNAADVFVMPSLEEAFGQTALESIACGTPVAAFGAGGIPDTVRHEQTGLLAKVGDSQQLRECIVRLLEDGSLWRRCSESGVRVAAQEFSMQLNADKYIRLYQSLMNLD